jgi:outer membrane lipoprotein-sorting protein
MRTPKTLLALLLLSFPLSPALAADPAPLPTAEELLARMEASVAKLSSFQADMRMTSQGSRSMEATTHFVFERSVKDGNSLECAFLTVNVTMKGPDGKEATHQQKTVSDGLFFWVETRSSDEPGISVTKNDVRSPMAPRMYTFLNRRTFFVTYALKVVGEETTDGRKMFVLEGSQAPDRLAQMQSKENKVKLWIGQDDMIPYRLISTGQRANQEQTNVTTMEFLNVKLNEKIDPEIFKYTPPPGAIIRDMTKPKP